jgi:hypothetical protein
VPSLFPSHDWTYVEPCCGSAALALALLGARRPLLPYQGSKWRFRKGLVARFDKLGFRGLPSGVQLDDAGPWGIVAAACADGPTRHDVIERLEGLAAEDARTVYDRLHGGAIPQDRARYAAEFLFLQRLSFSGKAVGDPNGRWASPGFNTSSAYGLPGTERFGSVNPMVPSLLRVLRGYDEQLAPVPVAGSRRSADRPVSVGGPTLVYLDPPYVRSTGYPGGALDRDAVVAVAQRWADAGATVVVSEGEAVQELVDAGWHAELLDAGRRDTSRFRGKQEEWITFGGTGHGAFAGRSTLRG